MTRFYMSRGRSSPHSNTHNTSLLRMILILLVVFFLPGTLLITLCAWPYLLGDEFPIEPYRIGFQLLFSIGNGGLDVIADIFGAKQFHPVCHSSQLDSYFTWALVAGGAGGVAAELVYSMIANVQVTLSFGMMFIALLVAAILFVCGSKRYIVRRQNKQESLQTAWAAVSATFCWKKADNGRVVACPPGFNKVKKSRGGPVQDDLVTAAKRLFMVIPVQGLFVPVNFSLLQMVTLLIPMSYSMQHPKLWTGPNMVSLSVYCSCFLFDQYLLNILFAPGFRELFIGRSHWGNC